MENDTQEKKTKIDWSNPEEVKLYKREVSRRWAQRNREKCYARTKVWQAEHKDVIAKNFAKYYENNKEKHKEVMREYHRQNRDEINRKSRERRAAKKAVDIQPDDPV